MKHFIILVALCFLFGSCKKEHKPNVTTLVGTWSDRVNGHIEPTFTTDTVAWWGQNTHQHFLAYIGGYRTHADTIFYLKFTSTYFYWAYQYKFKISDDNSQLTLIYSDSLGSISTVFYRL